MNAEKQTHTPGWSVIDASLTPHAYAAWHVNDSEGRTIAVLCNLKNLKANSALIIAAPDLLAACEAACYALRDVEAYAGALPKSAMDAWSVMTAAIAKARG